MATRAEPLPYGVGYLRGGWYLMILALVALTAWGVFAYSRQFMEGLIVTGMRDIGTMGGSTWGLYIAFDVYFVGISFAGITTAAVIRLFNLEHMKPVSRMAELLTVISLILAGFSIIPDLGQPIRGIVNLFLYARPQSPFFGTFTLVIAGYLFASLVYFYLEGRRDAALCARVPSRFRAFYRLWAAGYRDTPDERGRHGRASFILSIAILPLLITAHSTLGFVFGLQVGRPGWFSALQAPGFVVMAGISGIGLLIVIAAFIRALLGQRERLSLSVFRWLGNLLMVLTAAYLYFMVVDWLTTNYQPQEHEVNLTAAILSGRFAWLYWLSVATLVIPFLILFVQFLLRRHSLGLIVLSGLLVNVAAIGKRILLVVPSQTEGTLLPYGVGSYSPTWVEYSVVGGTFALGILLYVLFMKVFPIMEVQETEAVRFPRAEETRVPAGAGARSFRRLRWTLSMVVGGFILQAVSYFFLAAPWGFPPSSPAYSNPRAFLGPTMVGIGDSPEGLWGLIASPPAAAIFILGVMLVFLAAVVYEVLPDQQSPERGLRSQAARQ